MSIHKNYTVLTDAEKEFVDNMFDKSAFRHAEEHLGYRPLGDDSVEIAIEAVATWLVKSALAAGMTRPASASENAQ